MMNDERLEGVKRLNPISQEQADRWADGPEGRAVLDSIIRSDATYGSSRTPPTLRPSRRIAAYAAGLVILGMIAAGAASVAGREPGDKDRIVAGVATDPSDSRSTAEPAVDDVDPSVPASEASVGEVFDGETRELVMDGEGVTRGWIATAQEKSQQVQMIEHAQEFEEALSRTDGPLGRRPILEAIAALYPTEVRDEAGDLTGYWILGFVETEDYEAIRVQAEEYLATLQ